MKKSLIDEIKHIHKLSYGKLNEGVLSTISKALGSKIDDPEKADLVDSDVDEFYKNIEDSINSGGLSQQKRGSMNYQKGVESLQIGLTLLGYELPRFGIDGLFGNETASAVTKFKNDNNILNENSSELRSTLDDLGYDEKNNQITSGGEITDELSSIVSNVLRDFKELKPNVNVTITAGNDTYHQKLDYNSSHKSGNAIDVVIKPYNTENANAFKSVLDKYSGAKLSYIDEYINPSKASTGGHFHLQYGKTIKQNTNNEVVATPETLKLLLNKLKERRITSNDLRPLIDTIKINQIDTDGKDFNGLVNLVINNLEGGYYHPNMLQDGRVKDTRYSNSGETMFGLDRREGDNESSVYGREFWRLVDSQNAKNKWPWNYMVNDNPTLNGRLRELASLYIKEQYDSLSQKYLSRDARSIVNSYPPLLFNFVYATWNGSGWFRRFGTLINKNIESGITDPKQLLGIIISARVNSKQSLISGTGNKIAKISDNLINNIA